MLGVLVAIRVSHTDFSLKITVLSLFVADYTVVVIVYLTIFWTEVFWMDNCGKQFKELLMWNIGFFCIAWVGAVLSLALILGGRTEYTTSLWVGYDEFYD